MVELRQHKIAKVGKSLQLVNECYRDINEMVDKQGKTMEKIEDKTADAAINTKEAKNEMKKALALEKTFVQRIREKDWAVVCLLVSFTMVLLLFLLDINIGEESNY